MVQDEINKELYARNAELAVRNKTLSLLRGLDEIAMSALETGEMAHRVAAALAAEFFYPFVAIGVCDAPCKNLEWMSAACLDEEAKLCRKDVVWQPLKISGSENACARAVATCTQTEVKTLHEALSPSVSDEAIAEMNLSGQVQSVFILPLAAQKACLGVLVIGFNRSADDLTRYERETFAPLLNLVTIAVQKAQTYSSLVDTTKKLQIVNHKLKKLDAQKTEFLSIASHQLRTPLAAIRGYVDLMIDGSYGETSDKQKDVIGKIHGSLEGLIELVGQLLSVSRIESGKTNVEIESMNLVPICREVADFLSVKAKESGLELTCEVKELPPVLGDVSKVKEVMMNLTENALKYTDTGTVAIGFIEEPKFIRVEVRDTGIGLSKENIEKLFQKFSRVESSTVDHTGTGLGLYVCKRLVDAMGGEIWVESPGLGKGSTFIFRLKKVPAGKTVKKKQVKVV